MIGTQADVQRNVDKRRMAITEDKSGEKVFSSCEEFGEWSLETGGKWKGCITEEEYKKLEDDHVVPGLNSV